MRFRTKALLVGTLGGAALGIVLALVSSDGYDDAKSGESPLQALGPGDYLTLGISILTLARQFGQMLKRI